MLTLKYPRLLVAATALLCMAIASGCSSPPAQQAAAPENSQQSLVEQNTAPPEAVPSGALGEASVETPVPGDWLLVHMPAEMPHLNPFTSTDGYATRVMEHVFENLLAVNPESLEMDPAVAERWEESEDHLVYTFFLHKNVTFSDGQPLTAHDVKFSFDTMMDPKVDAAHIRGYFESVTSCDVIDDHTIRFTCSKPYWLHLVYLGELDIVPKHLYEGAEINNHPLSRKPVGSGPYVLESWDTGQQLVLARNPNYWRKGTEHAGYIDKWVYKVITDDNAALQVLLSGELDVLSMKPSQWVGRGSEPDFVERFQKKSWYSPFYNYIGWNARLSQFADKRVRQALTMLCDRETMRETVWEGLAQTVSAGFFPGSAAANPNIQPWPFDPIKAAALLDEADWKDTDGDGLRDKEGVAFRFQILLVNQSPEGEQIATYFKEELARQGIEMNLLALEWATLIERVHARNFEACMLGWSMPPFPDEYQLWHSSQTEEGSNYANFKNAEADEIIMKARETFDTDARNALFHRFHEIMHDEQPYTFLFSPSALMAVDKRVHNTIVYPLLRDRPRFEWFVPAELQRYGK